MNTALQALIEQGERNVEGKGTAYDGGKDAQSQARSFRQAEPVTVYPGPAFEGSADGKVVIPTTMALNHLLFVYVIFNEVPGRIVPVHPYQIQR
jgi:hypothetical protein